MGRAVCAGSDVMKWQVIPHQKAATMSRCRNVPFVGERKRQWVGGETGWRYYYPQSPQPSKLTLPYIPPPTCLPPAPSTTHSPFPILLTKVSLGQGLRSGRLANAIARLRYKANNNKNSGYYPRQNNNIKVPSLLFQGVCGH